MLKITKYAPNLDKLFETFDWYCGSMTGELSSGDDYLAVLLDSEALMPKDGVLSCGTDWCFMSLQGDQRRLAFRRWLSGTTEAAELMTEIGEDGKTADALADLDSSRKVATLTLLS